MLCLMCCFSCRILSSSAYLLHSSLPFLSPFIYLSFFYSVPDFFFCVCVCVQWFYTFDGARNFFFEKVCLVPIFKCVCRFFFFSVILMFYLFMMILRLLQMLLDFFFHCIFYFQVFISFNITFLFSLSWNNISSFKIPHLLVSSLMQKK